MGEEDIYWAETMAILTAMEIAIQKGWRDLWVESDSLTVVQNLNANRVPWKLKFRWDTCRRNLSKLCITHIFREANQAADQAANLATELEPKEIILFEGKPDWLTKWETPYGKYNRVV